MTLRRERFEVGDDVVVEASTYSGDVVVDEGEAGRVDVQLRGGNADGYRVEQRGHVISIGPETNRGLSRRFSSTDVVMSVPRGTVVRLKAGSGTVFVNARVGDADIAVASGDVRIETVEGDLNLKSASGDTYVEATSGRISVTTASGDLRVGVAGRDVSVNSASGDVVIDEVSGAMTIRTASGDVTVHRLLGAHLEGKTLSGTMRIGIPPNRIIDLDMQSLSGDLRNNLDEASGDDTPERSLTLRLKSLSGDVYLMNA